MEVLLSKMRTELEEQVQYYLKAGTDEIRMNDHIGKTIRMSFDGKMQCSSCGKPKKVFAQGFCYDCFSTKPEASPCIIKPELCEGHLGIGRDVKWEEKHHVQPHFVYLAVASGLKVGVTRNTQVPTRWIDQGASYAIRVAEVPYRKLAGDIEVALKEHFTDKTNWQRMLKNEIADFDLEEEKWQIEELLPADLAQYMTEDDEIIKINYPVITFPSKIKSLNFDKHAVVEGTLEGIKGQYFIFDGGRVMNIRRHTGYRIELELNT